MDTSVPLVPSVWICVTALLTFWACAVVSALFSQRNKWTELSEEEWRTPKESEKADSEKMFFAQLLQWVSGAVFVGMVMSAWPVSLRFWTFALFFLLCCLPAFLFGRCFSLFFVRSWSAPFRFFHFLLYPLGWLVSRCGFYAQRMEQKEEEEEQHEQENGNGPDEAEAPAMIRGVVGFSKVEVCEIMCPRVDVVALSVSDTLEKVMEVIHERGYSRMPVYESDLDHIVGFLYIKDLIIRVDSKQDFKWQDFLRPAIFVPETKKINVLLREFKKKRLHMAVVVDDYGGTSGIVTLEDILEEVVGEINDESDALDEDRLYQRIDADTYLFDGRMPIHDMCRLLDVDDNYFDIEDGDYESLAGLLLEEVGYFPSKGMTVRFKDFLFTVESIGQHRITRIRMNRIENKEDED